MNKEDMLRKIDEMPIDELQAIIKKALIESGITVVEDGTGITLSEWFRSFGGFH